MISASELRALRKVFFEVNVGKASNSVSKEFDFIVSCYSEDHRFYHTFSHIAHMMNELAAIIRNASLDELQIKALCLATFYHDIVYDPQAKDNEFQSAGYAYESLTSLGWESGFVGFVGDLICETAHRKPPSSFAAKALVDADLGILSDLWPAYYEYARNVRCEYSFLDDKQWCEGRIDFLQRMVDMPHIYYTQPSLEFAAYNNMGQEIDMLNLTLRDPKGYPLFENSPASAGA